MTAAQRAGLVASRSGTSALQLPGSFWPDADERLLLRAALLDGERSTSAWQRLSAQLDVDDPDRAAYPLLALLYRQLDNLDVDDPRLAKLRGIYRRTWYVNQLRRDRSKEAVEVAQPFGALVFDGWELVLRYYGDLGLRDVPALHLLVRPEHAAAAARALSELGWSGPSSVTPAFLRGRGPVSFENASRDLCFVHWRLFREFCAPERGVDSEDPWEHALEFDFGGVRARAPGAADELLHVCLSGARTGDGRSMMWIADAVAVLRVGDPAVDWDRLVRQAQRLRAALRTADALSFLREELGAPVPENVLEELRRVPARRREVLAHRAAARRWRLFGTAPEALTRFLRLTSDASVPRALADLPTFLRDDWGLERRTQVPVVATRKVAARLRRSLQREGARTRPESRPQL